MISIPYWKENTMPSCYAAALIPVAQEALGSVAEGQDANPVTADGHLRGRLVHLGVGKALRGNVAAHPCVEDAGAVDAQQHAQPGIFGRMVHVRKAVDAGQRIVRYASDYAVHHAGRSGRRSNLSRVEDVEAERVIGLVSGPVRDRDSLREPQGLGCLSRKRTLHAESGLSKRKYGLVKPKILQKGSAGLILFKVPENSFRQSAHGGAHRVREPHGKSRMAI